MKHSNYKLWRHIWKHLQHLSNFIQIKLKLKGICRRRQFWKGSSPIVLSHGKEKGCKSIKLERKEELMGYGRTPRFGTVWKRQKSIFFSEKKLLKNFFFLTNSFECLSLLRSSATHSIWVLKFKISAFWEVWPTLRRSGCKRGHPHSHSPPKDEVSQKCSISLFVGVTFVVCWTAVCRHGHFEKGKFFNSE